MQQQVKFWHLLAGILVSIVSGAAMVFSQGVARGAESERTRITLEYHQKQITEITVNAAIDRKENKERDDRTFNLLMDMQLMLKDKEDRQK